MFTLSSTGHLSQIRCLFDLNTPQNSSDFTVVGQVFTSNTPSIKVKSASCSLYNEQPFGKSIERKTCPRMYIITNHDMQYTSDSRSLADYTYAGAILSHSDGPIRINGQVHKMTVFLGVPMYSAYIHRILKSFAENLCALFPLGNEPRIKSSAPANVPARDQSEYCDKMLPFGKNCDRKAGIATDSYHSVSIATKFRLAYFNSPKQGITPVLAYFSSLRQELQLGLLTPVLGHNSFNWDSYRDILCPNSTSYGTMKVMESCNR